MFNRIYHLTSKRKWGEIWEEGCLKPLSDPGLDRDNLSYKARLVIQDTKYLVGIPPGYLKVWDEYGLLSDVERHAVYGVCLSSRPDKNEIVVLSVPILSEECTFVREHKFPTYIWGNQFMSGAVCAVDNMYKSSGMSMARKEQIDFVDQLWLEYFNSTTSLKEYHEPFVVPEVWLPQETPVGLIETLSLDFAMSNEVV